MSSRSTRFLAVVFSGWFVFFWLCYLIPSGVPEEIGYRKVLTFPGWSDHPFTSDWLQKVSTWALDHSPFRYHTIVWRNRAFYRAALSAPSAPINPGHAEVCSGRHEFLFFLGDSPGYRAPHTLEKIAQNAVTFARAIHSSGRKFYFVPMPDKSSVYPEEVGTVFKWADAKSRRRVLPSVLEAHFASAPDLKGCYIPLWDIFQTARKSDSELLYWKHCTHWTTRGAFIGLEQMLNRVEPGVFDMSQVTRRDNGENYQGDLTLHMLLQPDFETGPTYDIHLAPEHKLVPGRTLFILDSFIALRLDLFTPWFESVETVTPDDTLANITYRIGRADTVILGIVERTLAYRLERLTNKEFLAGLPPKDAETK